MADPKVDVRVKTTTEGTGALGRVGEALNNIRTQGGAAGKAIEGLARTITGPFAAVTAVVGSISVAFQGVSRAIKEFAEAQEKVAGLDAALGRQGQLTEEYRARLQELAATMEATTAIADDQWLDVLTRLTQFGVGPDSMDGAVEAIKNLAGVTGDLRSAAELYVRALQGQFDALRRYGIVLDETGDKVSKLNQLHEKAAQIGGGQLEARAKSLTGQFSDLKNQAANLMEAAGGLYVWATNLGERVEFVSGAFQWWAEKLGGTIPKLEGINNTLAPQIDALRRAGESARAYAAHLENVRGVSEAIVQTIQEENKALKEKGKIQDELASERMAIEIAGVDEQVATGQITNRGGLQQKQEIRARYRAEEFSRRQAEAEAQIQRFETGKRDIRTEIERIRAERSTAEQEYSANSQNPPPRVSSDPEQTERLRQEIVRVGRSGDDREKRGLPALLARYNQISTPNSGYDFAGARQRIGQMRTTESTLEAEYSQLSGRVDPQIAALREGQTAAAGLYQMQTRRHAAEARVETLSAFPRGGSGEDPATPIARNLQKSAAGARGDVQVLLSRTMEDIQALIGGVRGNMAGQLRNSAEIRQLRAQAKDQLNR